MLIDLKLDCDISSHMVNTCSYDEEWRAIKSRENQSGSQPVAVVLSSPLKALLQIFLFDEHLWFYQPDNLSYDSKRSA